MSRLWQVFGFIRDRYWRYSLLKIYVVIVDHISFHVEYCVGLGGKHPSLPGEQQVTGSAKKAGICPERLPPAGLAHETNFALVTTQVNDTASVF